MGRRVHLDVFRTVSIVSTGTTGGLLSDEYPDLDVTSLKSGPLGGGTSRSAQ